MIKARLAKHFCTLFTIAFAVIILLNASRAHAIDGGHRVSKDDPIYSSLVQVLKIQKGSIGMCSGVFIATNLVVTAAHCVTDPKTGAFSEKAKILIHRGSLEQDWEAT